MRKTNSLTMFLLLWTSLMTAQEKANTNHMPYAEGSTSNFEVVITYDSIETNKKTRLTLYISDFKTNAPIENAKLELDIAGIDNSKINIQPSSDPGVYEALVEFPEIKKYNFLIAISDADKNDLIAINDVDIGQVENLPGKDKESASFTAKIRENVLIIIISTFTIIMIALVFYRMGRNKSSSKNLNKEIKNSTEIKI